jgi:hypothetical protein
MNQEDKLARTITRMGNVGIIVLPILTILYSLWVQLTPFFIFLQSYEIILYICNLILWIGISLTLSALLLRKRLVLGFILIVITTPCLTFSSLSLMRDSPSTIFFTNLPTLYDHKTLDNDDYYLTSEVGDHGTPELRLYKCGNKRLYCELVFIDQDRFGGHLVIDQYNNEVNIVNNDPCGLLYSDGEYPQRYESCSGAKAGGYIYYLSENCSKMSGYSCNTYTYTLYQCQLANILCIQIPFEYKINHEVYLYLESNETSNEISIYNDYDDNKTLIYSYGAHPSCHIEGCKILKRTK